MEIHTMHLGVDFNARGMISGAISITPVPKQYAAVLEMANNGSQSHIVIYAPPKWDIVNGEKEPERKYAEGDGYISMEGTGFVIIPTGAWTIF